MKTFIVLAIIGVALYFGFGILASMPWWGIALVVLGVALFGGVVIAGIGALGTVAGLMLLGLFLAMDGATKKRRRAKYDASQERKKNGY